MFVGESQLWNLNFFQFSVSLVSLSLSRSLALSEDTAGFKIIHPSCVLDKRITADSVKYKNSFVQNQFNIMFRHIGPSPGWQEWKINKRFRVEIEIHANLCAYLPFLSTWWCHDTWCWVDTEKINCFDVELHLFSRYTGVPARENVTSHVTSVTRVTSQR
jgi:hypothetical protein